MSDSPHEPPPQFGFQGILRPEFPSQILVDAEERCNLKCLHCRNAEMSEMDGFGNTSLDPEINRKFIDEVAEKGEGICQYIRYSGQGETMLHPQIFDLLSYAKSRLKIPVNLTTNGTLLDEKRIIRLLEMGVDMVDISIDAHKDETYAKIRGGKLEITRRNVLNLIRLRNAGGFKCWIVVSFIEQPLNQGESENFKKFWQDAGANYVVIRQMHSCAGAKPGFDRHQNDRYPCLWPWERLVIGASGEVRYCPADWEHGSVLANLRTATLEEIWQGKEMKQLRQAHMDNDFSQHSFCGKCPDWRSTRWPSQGRSWASLVQNMNEESS
jgi:radical SAM protein with 4Fe4S-binding SPASM domain